MGLILLLSLFGSLPAAFAAEAAPADEPAVTYIADLRGLMDMAASSFGERDMQGYQAALAELDRTLGLLAVPLRPSEVGDLHLLHGLRFLSPDGGAGVAEAMPYLAAARASQDWSRYLGAELASVPDLAQVWERAAAQTPTQRDLPPSWMGRLQVDTRAQHCHPVDQPYVLQRIRNGDRVLQSEYVDPGEVPSHYPRLRTGLLTVAVVSKLASVAIYQGVGRRRADAALQTADAAIQAGADPVWVLEEKEQTVYLYMLPVYGLNIVAGAAMLSWGFTWF